MFLWIIHQSRQCGLCSLCFIFSSFVCNLSASCLVAPLSHSISPNNHFQRSNVNKFAYIITLKYLETTWWWCHTAPNTEQTSISPQQKLLQTLGAKLDTHLIFNQMLCNNFTATLSLYLPILAHEFSISRQELAGFRFPHPPARGK